MLLEKMRNLQEACWNNPHRKSFSQAIENCPVTMDDVLDAAARLDRFAGYFKVAFPETQVLNGLVESPLRQIPSMQAVLSADQNVTIPGKLFLKMDSHLPISGSIKARGGIYEVLCVAEKIALEQGLLKETDDYARFNTPEIKKCLSEYSIAVGSTGNLGMSIGIMSASLGFRVTVHMSADARQWKKDLLRSKGVNVIEYASDYSEAVRQGRAQAALDPKCHFIDDENSKMLFLGYAVAALRVKDQLAAAGVRVDEQHPLQVYLPCGVGGGPGGVAFGLKLMYGDAVQCFFAEPVNACCMMLGMSTGKHSEISVADIGISGQTAADGLAVGRASGFVGKLMEPFLAGCYTLTDRRMYRMLHQLADSEGIYLEPSALAGMYGPVLMQKEEAFAPYRDNGNTTHLVWATGGSLVPKAEMEKYYALGGQ